MIEKKFEDSFPPDWIKTHITSSTHELPILRELIPWQKIIDGLYHFRFEIIQ